MSREIHRLKVVLCKSLGGLVKLKFVNTKNAQKWLSRQGWPEPHGVR